MAEGFKKVSEAWTKMTKSFRRSRTWEDENLSEENGHTLSPELTDIQLKHKQHLLEQAKTLEEPPPPGSILESQRFPIDVNLNVFYVGHCQSAFQNELTEIERQQDTEHCGRADNGLEERSCCLRVWCEDLKQTIITVGSPGIGKNAMLQKFVYDWVNGSCFGHFDFVFFFNFQELNHREEVSLEEMIIGQYPYLEEQIGNILQCPERLLFLFDDLDERIHKIKCKSCTDPKQREYVGVVVDGLVHQSLLRGCSIMGTSRSTVLEAIDSFSSKLKDVTLYSFCCNPPTNSDQMMSSLPKTMTQLFVTFLSNILANRSQNKEDTPTSRDLLLSIGRMAEHGVMKTMNVFDEHHLQLFDVTTDNDLFSCLMTKTGQTSDAMIFIHVTLQEFLAALVHFIDYNPDNLQQKLDRAESSKYGSGKIFLCFLCGLSNNGTRSMLESHIGELSAQASKHVISWVHEKKLPKSKISKSYKRELLSLFYCLYEIEDKDLVSQCFGSNRDIDFSDRKLTRSDCSVLSYIIESFRETDHLNLTACSITSEGLRELLPALHRFKNLSLGHNYLTDSSCPILASAIRDNQTLRRIDLSWNDLEGPHLRDLMMALATSQIEELILEYSRLTHSSCPMLVLGFRNNQTLRKLNLSDNRLEGPHFFDLITALTTSRVEELILKCSGIVDTTSTLLAQEIGKIQTLRKLNLSNQDLKGPFYNELMEIMPKTQIEELVLKRNDLTDNSCTQLALAIRDNKTLRKLDLYLNNLEGPNFRRLMRALTANQRGEFLDTLRGPHFRDLMTALPTSRIEELILCGTELTHHSCAHLALGIRNNQTLRKLDLSGNNLRGSHFSDLMAALTTSRIEELLLPGNKLTGRSSHHLATGIRNNQTLKKLDLSDNHLGGRRFNDLINALGTSQIEELNLRHNELPHSSCTALGSGLRNNQTLRNLDLSINNLGGPHFSDLLEALTTTKIEELHLHWINLYDRSSQHLATGIRNNQTLKKLDLSSNNLWGPHFNDVMIALTTSQIEELNISSNDLPHSSCTILASILRNNQILRKLDLSNNYLEGPHLTELLEALTTTKIEELRLLKVLKSYGSDGDYRTILESLKTKLTLHLY